LYRLPTETEWEYACRGGATSQKDCAFDFYFSQPTNDLSAEQANFTAATTPLATRPRGSTLERTTKVGSYKPNRLGIYDMHGNVWEGARTTSRREARPACSGRQLVQRRVRLPGVVPLLARAVGPVQQHGRPPRRSPVRGVAQARASPAWSGGRGAVKRSGAEQRPTVPERKAGLAAGRVRGVQGLRPCSRLIFL